MQLILTLWQDLCHLQRYKPLAATLLNRYSIEALTYIPAGTEITISYTGESAAS